MVSLKPWDKHKRSVNQIIGNLKERTNFIEDAKLQSLPPPAVSGFGNASGFELRILDRTGTGNLQQTYEVIKRFIVEASTRKVIGEIFTSFNPNFPHYIIHIDQDMAMKKGITSENAMRNLQTLIGS